MSISRIVAVLIAVGAAVQTAPASKPATAPAHPAHDKMDTGLALKDIDGKMRRPLAAGDTKAAVLFFITHDCPISNGYSPEINRICQDFAGKISFHLVHPYAELNVGAAQKHARDYGYTVPVIIDGQRQLTKAAGAKTTPEAVVVGPDGRTLYRGRIDDLWSDYGKRRAEPTVRDLRDALSAILDGKPVPTPVTQAIGCPIEP